MLGSSGLEGAVIMMRSPKNVTGKNVLSGGIAPIGAPLSTAMNLVSAERNIEDALMQR